MIAYRFSPRKSSFKFPTEVLVKFLDLTGKTRILECFCEQTEVIIAGSQLVIYPDMSLITLPKQNNLKFLTMELPNKGITYRWGFPFKLIVITDSRQHIVKTITEASGLLELIKLRNNPQLDKS